MNILLHPRHLCFHWLLRRMRRKCIFNTSSTCPSFNFNLICYYREESTDDLDISQPPVFGTQDYLEWCVLVHPQHGIGGDKCRAGQGKFVYIPRKTGSARGDVSGVVGGYTFHFVKSPSPFLGMEGLCSDCEGSEWRWVTVLQELHGSYR